MRINIFGGPCSGKSTVAAKLFCHLKTEVHTHVELVQEYVKDWAYEKREPKGFDQLYFLAKQIRRESLLLESGVTHIVTDSPVLMSCVYAFKYSTFPASNLVATCESFEATFPSVNVLLDRGSLPYEATGRYETHDEALEMDRRIRGILDATSTKYTMVNVLDFDKILATVLTAISS